MKKAEIISTSNCKQRQKNGITTLDHTGHGGLHLGDGAEIVIFGIGKVFGPISFFDFLEKRGIFGIVSVDIGVKVVDTVEDVDMSFAVVVLGPAAAVASLDIDTVLTERTAVEDAAFVHNAVEADPDGALAAAGVEFVHGKAVGNGVAGTAPADDVAAGTGGLGAVGKGNAVVDGAVSAAGKSDAVGVEEGTAVADHTLVAAAELDTVDTAPGI